MYTKHKAFVVACAACISVGIASIGYRETRSGERDRHAVRTEIEAIERAIRAHGPDMWERIEAPHEGGSATPDDERSHQEMLRDFDRLGHIDSFAMDGIHIRLSGDTALVRYAVRGRTARRGDSPAPAGGEFRLRKGPDGKWRLIAHSLIETR